MAHNFVAASLPNFRSWFPARRSDAHKNDFGHVLVIGGSMGMMGAPRLAALGALRGGAGLVTIAVPKSLEPIAAAGPWEAMTLPLPDRSGGMAARGVSSVRSFLETRRVSSVALGPGLGGRKETASFVEGHLASVSVPTVLDADGLNALALLRSAKRISPLILTPHPGEMARLLGVSATAVQKDRRSAAREAARRFKAIVVLKGRGSVVSDGERAFVNPTGNPGMAAAGMGDVLAGLLAALIGQVSAVDLPERLWRAALFGVYLHGLAGDLAVKETGQASLMAGDVASRLPGAFRKIFPS